jgi:hypothetical protein
MPNISTSELCCFFVGEESIRCNFLTVSVSQEAVPLEKGLPSFSTKLGETIARLCDGYAIIRALSPMLEWDQINKAVSNLMMSWSPCLSVLFILLAEKRIKHECKERKAKDKLSEIVLAVLQRNAVFCA